MIYVTDTNPATGASGKNPCFLFQSRVQGSTAYKFYSRHKLL
jgi:hypothetical protein